MTASVNLQVSASTTRFRVSGLTPPSASVAPMTARSFAVTLSEHCRRVELDRVGRLDGELPAIAEQLANRLIAGIALTRRCEHGFVHGKRAAGKSRQSVENKPPLFFERRTRSETGCGDGARVDHRIRSAVLAALDRRQRVERQPSRINAQSPARSVRAQDLQDQCEHKRLRHAHDRERNVPIAARVRPRR